MLFYFVGLWVWPTLDQVTSPTLLLGVRSVKTEGALARRELVTFKFDIVCFIFVHDCNSSKFDIFLPELISL